MIPSPFRLLLIAALAAILLSACSLAGDITPPPGSVSVSSKATAPASTVAAPPVVADSSLGFPSARPSAANGAAVFAAHCAQCHGAAGAGDGPMAAQLQVPPANITDPTLNRNATPAKWFETISRGNIDRFMPPFSNALSETERWDVIFYLFSLDAPQASVDAGKDTYSAMCAGCHGETGKGDGPEAAGSGGRMPDLSDIATMAAKNQNDLFSAVSQGVGQAMPSFGDTLTEDERWSAVTYIRTLSYDYLAPGAKPAEAHGTIAGQVANGTSGAPAPSGLDVVLYGFDQFQLATTVTETMKADSSFAFGDVPFVPGRVFIVATEYNGVSYSSDIASFKSGAAHLDVPLRVYETTTDPGALRVDRMHVFFDFSSAGARVTVGELFIITNTGDKTVGSPTGLSFDLPQGAADLRLQNMTAGQDYTETPAGFALTTSIPPGGNGEQVLASFSLPYDRRLAFSQKLPLPVATVNVLVPELGLKVSSDVLQAEGVRDVQGTQFQSFTGTGLAAGSTLAFKLSGKAGAAALTSAGDGVGLVVGGLGLALVVGGLGWWFYSRRTPPSAAGQPAASPADRERLVQAIADLDDAFEAGEISQADCERKRAALKAELIESWAAPPPEALAGARPPAGGTSPAGTSGGQSKARRRR